MTKTRAAPAGIAEQSARKRAIRKKRITMNNLINATLRLERIAQQFANIAAGRWNYNQHCNAWQVPAQGWGIKIKGGIYGNE